MGKIAVKFAVIVAASALCADITAQSIISPHFDVLSDEDMYVEWSQRPLTIDDFQVRDKAVSDNCYSMDMEWDVRQIKGRKGNLRYDYPEIVTKFNRALSWAVRDSMKESDIRFCQTVFDLRELYGRRLQLAINDDSDESVKPILDSYEEALARMDDETGGGTDQEKMEQYRKEIAMRLDTMQTPLQVPEIGPFAAGLGWYVTVGGISFINDDAARQYDPDKLSSFSLGFQFLIGKSAWTLDVTGHEMFLAQPMSFAGKDWDVGQSTSVNSLSLLYSRTILETPLLDVDPFVGAGLANYFMRTDSIPKSESNDKKSGLSLSAGMDFRIKPCRVVKSDYSNYYDIALRGRVFVMRESAAGVKPVTTLNLAVGLDFNIGDRKLRFF